MNNQYPQQQQMSSGLARYRSAPSSFWDTILNGSDDDDVGFGTDGLDKLFNSPRASTPDQTHIIFSKLVSSSSRVEAIQENRSSSNTSSLHFQTQSQQLHSQSIIVQQLQPQKSTTDYSTTMMYTDVEKNNSFNSNQTAQIKMEGSGNSGGLIRHSSSPAGFFANLDIQKEFGAMRGMDNSGPGNYTSNAEGSFSSAITFKRHIDFSSKNSSSSGMMAPISRIGKKRSVENNPGQGDGHFVEDRSNNGGDYVPGFSTNSWNNSQMLADDFFEGLVDNNGTFTNANVLDTKNNEGGRRPAALLSHRRSLPASSAEFFAIENLLEDSVPCKIRAKRGFATHPRSIAERVRRTNISNRIKKLQDLVPNMEKQTNTADMLDLAVDYIKDLQRQVKKLSDDGAKCSCIAKEKS